MSSAKEGSWIPVSLVFFTTVLYYACSLKGLMDFLILIHTAKLSSRGPCMMGRPMVPARRRFGEGQRKVLEGRALASPSTLSRERASFCFRAFVVST